MKDEIKKEMMEGRMKMWKMRKEMLEAMNDKELRAFITGYMMAESKMLRKLGSKCSCGCKHGCSCGPECSCHGGSCSCENK